MCYVAVRASVAVSAGANRQADEARLAAALPKAADCLQALADLRGDGPWLAGRALSLADLHAAPMFVYFRMAAEGAELLSRQPGLAAWWDLIAVRPSLAATRSPLE